MVTIRDAVVADATGIAAVHVASWQAAYRDILDSDFLAGLSVEQRTQRWEQMLHEAAGVAVACNGTGEIIAFASYGPARDFDEPSLGELYAIYAVESSWDRGVGRQLLAAVVDALRKGGYERAMLWVIDGNTRARRFYERQGWTFDGITQDEVIGGTPIVEMRYARQL